MSSTIFGCSLAVFYSLLLNGQPCMADSWPLWSSIASEMGVSLRDAWHVFGCSINTQTRKLALMHRLGRVKHAIYVLLTLSEHYYALLLYKEEKINPHRHNNKNKDNNDTALSAAAEPGNYGITIIGIILEVNLVSCVSMYFDLITFGPEFN